MAPWDRELSDSMENWTKETSFDYALYDKLEAAADYFLLHDLLHWIQKQRYLKAVKTVVEIEIFPENDLCKSWIKKRCNADVEVQTFHSSYYGEKRFQNSCVTYQNHGNTKGYESCEELMRAFRLHYDDLPKKLTVLTKRIEFDETVCVNGAEL
jgi:hypothetical protein